MQVVKGAFDKGGPRGIVSTVGMGVVAWGMGVVTRQWLHCFRLQTRKRVDNTPEQAVPSEVMLTSSKLQQAASLGQRAGEHNDMQTVLLGEHAPRGTMEILDTGSYSGMRAPTMAWPASWYATSLRFLSFITWG